MHLCSSHILTWIRLDMVHLVEIFRDKKLLKSKQTHTQKKQVLNQITILPPRVFGGAQIFNLNQTCRFKKKKRKKMRLINQKSEPGAHLKPFVWVRFTHHNSSVVLAYEDASTVVVVRHARAWSWRGKKYTVAMSQEIQTKSFSFPQQWQACA